MGSGSAAGSVVGSIADWVVGSEIGSIVVSGLPQLAGEAPLDATKKVDSKRALQYVSDTLRPNIQRTFFRKSQHSMGFRAIATH